MKSSLILLSLFTFAACSGPTGNSQINDPALAREQRAGTVFGDSFTLGGNKGSNGESLAGVSVNAFLWRASLDTISFMPLNQVDPFGGVIITDWFSPADQPNERFKLNVYILTQDLRSDGIRVSAFKETKNATGQWDTAKTTEDFSLKIEDSILIRARQMRVSALETADN